MIDTNYEFFKGHASLAHKLVIVKNHAIVIALVVCMQLTHLPAQSALHITKLKVSCYKRSFNRNYFAAFYSTPTLPSIIVFLWRHQRIANGFRLQFLIGVAEENDG